MGHISRHVAIAGLALVVVASCSSSGSTTRPASAAANAGSVPTDALQARRFSLPPLPPIGLAVQTTTGVQFVDLAGKGLAHLDGYTLTINWRPDQRVAVEDRRGRRLALDLATNALVPESSPLPEQPSDWPKLPPPPSPSTAVIVSGHWRWAVPSPDGKTLLAQWSGECEVPDAFFVSTGVEPRSVWSSNWADAPDTFGLGWASNGRAVIFLMGEPGCGGPSPSQGVYLVDLNGTKRLIYRGSNAELWRR